MPSVISKRAGALASLTGIVLGVLLLALGYGRDVPTPTSEPFASSTTEEKTATLLFVGDLMFDRYVGSMLEAQGAEHVLGGVATFLQEADLTVGNLEGPVTSSASVSRGSRVGDPVNMRFTFATTVPMMLARQGFDLVSLGNNHMLDFGSEGATETKLWLARAGISFVGDPTEVADDIVLKDVNGIEVAFLGYNDFFGKSAGETRLLIKDIIATEHPDFIVVLAHWGEEYLPEPPERIRKIGRSFIDAGADLVIGSHPHVVQTYENYRNARIYYSLGNFVFDQYWNEEVRCGRAVSMSLIKENVETHSSFSQESVGMRTDGSTVLGCI